MRKLKKNLISTFGFLLLIALTVAIYYLLPYEKLLMDKTTLFGVIVSEVITLLGTLFYNTVSGKKKLTMTAGGYTILFGYQALVFILSILFAFYYRNAIATYKIVFVCLTGVFFISSVLVYFFGKKVADKSNDVDNACRFFKELEYKTESLNSIDCEKTIHCELKKIDDAVKSCDQSVCVDTDNLIDESINTLLEQLNLKEGNNERILEICEKTMCLIKQRNAEVSRLKIGGI